MKQKISLVLSGGGARGIAHIGVIEELLKNDYEIHAITGTSMGALVGGVYAQGKMDDLKNWLYTLDKMKLFQLVDFTFSLQGFVKGDKVLKKMKDFIPDINIEDLSIHFQAVATDLLNKEEIVFREGSLYTAIRASISIPTVFTPVRIDNKLLVDGGVLNNIPIKYAVRQPDDKLIVVNVNADCPVYNPFLTVPVMKGQKAAYQKKINEIYEYLNEKWLKSSPINDKPISKIKNMGYFELMNKTLTLMMNHADNMLLQQYQPDYIINISRDSAGTFDFFRAEELVEIGRGKAAELLKK